MATRRQPAILPGSPEEKELQALFPYLSDEQIAVFKGNGWSAMTSRNYRKKIAPETMPKNKKARAS